MEYNNNNKKQESYIEMSNYGTTIKTTFDHNDLNAPELLNAFIAGMYGITFHNNTINKTIIEYLESENFKVIDMTDNNDIVTEDMTEEILDNCDKLLFNESLHKEEKIIALKNIINNIIKNE